MKKSDQRIVHKRERAAERQVLAGGHSRLIRGDSWSHPSTLIANDDETRYPKPSKKKGKSKRRFQGCPDRPFWNKGKCECLEEEVTIRDWIWDREAGGLHLWPPSDDHEGLCLVRCHPVSRYRKGGAFTLAEYGQVSSALGQGAAQEAQSKRTISEWKAGSLEAICPHGL
jgi:hypothetical protein